LVSDHEVDAAELADIPNIVLVSFTDGAYKTFPESQKIADGVWFIRAEGHTKGNSIVIVEDASEGIYYMIHGDITYVDEALYANKLSVVFEDLEAARTTVDRVREFVTNNPTVYLSTHTPQGPENLAARRIVDLNNPPETIPVGEITFKTRTDKYVCGYVYDPAEHDSVAFEDLPYDWKCPRCKRPKTAFNAA
jgi:rubredoxin